MKSASLCLLACALAAQTPADLFAADKVNDIRLTFAPGDWEKLRATYLEDTYYKVQFEWQSVKVANIGVRSRGSGSRNSAKPGMKLDFNEFVKDQTFLGFKELVLDNLLQDPSMMAERVSFQLFRRMGIPAPSVAHVRVFVNGSYHGLYTVVEPVDKLFLKKYLGEDGGQLFDYEWQSHYSFEDLGDSNETYAFFKPKTNDKKPDYETLKAFIQTINSAPDEAFAGALAEYLDANRFLEYLAVETFLADIDGVLGDWGMNNFYLYRRGASKQFVFIPWDKDVTFGPMKRSVWNNAETNVLVRRLLAIPAYGAHFERSLQTVIAEAGPSGGWLDMEINRIKAQIHTFAALDTNKPYSTDHFYTSIRDRHEFTRTRPYAIRAELGVR
ncbi:MAG: hypothetical protein FJW30_24190 [Acidobacteria bacterium]|nr:hypothetical protein [Acidobacteriota bacterium]